MAQSVPAKLHIWLPLTLAVGIIVALQLSQLFAPLETAITLVFFTSPLTLVFLKMMAGKIDALSKIEIPYRVRYAASNKISEKSKTYRISKTYCNIMAGILFASALVRGLLVINIICDTSTPEQMTFTVTDSMSKTAKNSKHYYAKIDTPDFIRLPLHFGFGEKVFINKDEYERIEPHETRITLEVHKGFLGFPWFTRAYQLEGLKAASPSYTAPAMNVNEDTATLKAACLWGAHFNAATAIENIPPQDYRRDFWAGGEPRSVEPLVNGQNHGIGHYTFANGKMYGDIPWRNGQKHGAFTLYREDGTRDQTLSYKDGHLFGINEWYLPNGEVKESWLYLNDDKVLNVHVCYTYKGQ